MPTTEIDPARNGNSRPAKARPGRRRLVIGGVIVFVAAWTVALIYSVTAGGRSPERLEDPAAKVVETACLDAQRELSAIPQIGVRATTIERATRVERENAIYATMIGRMRALHPEKTDPAAALTFWLDDWQGLIKARRDFASDLRTRGVEARFVEPATEGIKPIADKMNDWTLEQGTRTDACNTGSLQVEVVEGRRVYGPERKS